MGGGHFPLTRKLRQLTYCDRRYRRRRGSRAVSPYNQYAFTGACPLRLGPDRLATAPWRNFRAKFLPLRPCSAGTGSRTLKPMSTDEQSDLKNQTILVMQPNSDRVMLVVAVVLQPDNVDLEELLAALVPEMAKGEVKGGMLVVGDSTLVVRNTGEEVMVDEVDTSELLALADLEEPWNRENLVKQLEWWIGIMSRNWRDRALGRLKELLVPYLVAGLQGEVVVVDDIWGTKANRVGVPVTE